MPYGSGHALDMNIMWLSGVDCSADALPGFGVGWLPPSLRVGNPPSYGCHGCHRSPPGDLILTSLLYHIRRFTEKLLQDASLNLLSAHVALLRLDPSFAADV